MKRSTVLLISCATVALSVWLAHVVSGQNSETKEKTFTITQTQLDEYVAKKVAKALAEHEKTANDKDKPATDEQVLNPQNWHKAIFNKIEFVVYTGPGTLMFHHWVDTGAKAGGTKVPATKSGAATVPAAKGE